MYFATVFFHCLMYSSIIRNPTSSLAVAADVYYHFPSVFHRRSHPISRRTTCSWNPPRNIPMQGMTIQIYAPNISTACTMDLNKNPDTRGSAPSLLRIIVILFHTTLALENS